MISDPRSRAVVSAVTRSDWTVTLGSRPRATTKRGFLVSSELRPPGVLLAEDDRTYDLWCCTAAARRNREPLPPDLNWWVLYERRYAFEWLDGQQDWDDVKCDA